MLRGFLAEVEPERQLKIKTDKIKLAPNRAEGMLVGLPATLASGTDPRGRDLLLSTSNPPPTSQRVTRGLWEMESREQVGDSCKEGWLVNSEYIA